MFKNGLFPHHMNLGNNLEEVRNSIRNFKLDSSGIDFLSFQAGVGKTHYTKELLKNRSSYLLVTGSHKLLEGEYEGLKARHWIKFSEQCENYTEQVQDLDSWGVSKRFICDIQGCDKRKCPYWIQFNTNKAIAPFHYLTTDRVLNADDKFKFDMLIVDEAMDYGTEYALDVESLKKSVQTMSKYEDVKFLEELNWNAELFDYLQVNINSINSKRYGALNGAISEKQGDDVKEIAKFRPYNLIRYYYYHSIYGNSSSYYEPLFYTVFDLARQEVPIIMLDASFDIKAYEVTLARYNFEHKQLPRDIFSENPLGPITDLSTIVYSSNIQEKHKNVYRMDNNNYYYKTWLLGPKGNKDVKELQSFIKRTKRKYKNVGLITYKGLKLRFTNLDESNKEHFYNLRGSNKLKDVEVLFIVGTPQKPSQPILDEYNKLCLTEFTENDTYKPAYKNKDGKTCLLHKYEDMLNQKHEIWDCNNGQGYEEKKHNPHMIKGDYEFAYIDKFEEQSPEGEIDLELWYKFSEYSFNQDESEQYQAIHRARPFLKDNPIIYLFGDVPEKIKEEFNVVSYDKNVTRLHFLGSRPGNIGVYPLVLWHEIINYFTKTGSTSKEIAKRLKIYKKDKKGYNTPFITKIKKGISPEDVINVDKLLKADIKVTYNKIKQKHPHIKMDKDLIEDFIFYAREGSFINL